MLLGAHIEYMPTFSILGSTVRVLVLKSCIIDVNDLLTLLRPFTLLERLSFISPKSTGNSTSERSAKEWAQDPVLPLRDVCLISGREGGFSYDDRDNLNKFLLRSGAKLTTIDIR